MGHALGMGIPLTATYPACWVQVSRGRSFPSSRSIAPSIIRSASRGHVGSSSDHLRRGGLDGCPGCKGCAIGRARERRKGLSAAVGVPRSSMFWPRANARWMTSRARWARPSRTPHKICNISPRGPGAYPPRWHADPLFPGQPSGRTGLRQAAARQRLHRARRTPRTGVPRWTHQRRHLSAHQGDNPPTASHAKDRQVVAYCRGRHRVHAEDAPRPSSAAATRLLASRTAIPDGPRRVDVLRLRARLFKGSLDKLPCPDHIQLIT